VVGSNGHRTVSLRVVPSVSQGLCQSP
jgi:hypothetical protein